MTMTTKQARVVDLPLTSIARGYGYVWAKVANILFPIVPVDERGGVVIEFGVKDFALINSARVSGSITKRVEFGHEGAPYVLTDHSLEGKIPVEIDQEAGQRGIDMYQRTIRGVQRLMDTEREVEAANAARDESKYVAGNKKVYATDAERWDDPSSSPVLDVRAAKEVIRSAIGVYPDTLTVSPKARNALEIHPDILATLTVNDVQIATLAQIARALGVERVVVGDATYHDGTKFVDVWGKDAVLAYTAVASLDDGGSPAFGYTYQLRDHPFVEEPYIDRPHKSEIVPVTDCRKPVLAGAVAGYYFKNVVK